MKSPLFTIAMPVLVACTVTGCQGWPMVGPDYQKPKAVTADVWQVQTPNRSHQQEDWWRQFNDEVLLEIITAAERNSATVADAYKNIASARANLVAARAMGFDGLSATPSITRKAFSFGGDPTLLTQQQISFDTSWEIDLFGGLRRERESSLADYDAKRNLLQDARLSVASESAKAYNDYRFCQQKVRLYERYLESKTRSAELTASATAHGFKSDSDNALAQATQAQAASDLNDQQMQCELQIKAMVALTGIAEPQLRERLAPRDFTVLQPGTFDVPSVPAALLEQRPDLLAAERDLASASAEVGVKEANRYPKITLSGNITPVRFINSGTTSNAVTWSIGPTIDLPLFDMGQRKANVAAAWESLRAADSNYRSKARNAIKEVEQKLLTLQSYNARQPSLEQAANNYMQALDAISQRYEAGFDNAIDLETTRRNALEADYALTQLNQNRITTLIELYIAIGGGWQGPNTPLAAADASSSNEK
ncbi:efflux transporter outer membrane subunit [Methylovorus mays]|uniref:efflux transporter outer membrane subunit n=1 Tax=Methylovorus mays TaxID=184077 RepID=UPI001E4B04E5|nr:efflux transporter outer membrane subunit [Methylovorus mays]MCB5206990.1 efflux transporter outer membrane subunit [Methylovorus mays]